jgi:hypothetical protein
MNSNVDNKIKGPKLWLILWSAFHGFALLMSVAKIRLFYAPNHPICNPPSNPQESFWPFVDYTSCEFYPQDYPEGTTGYEAVFDGLFAYYDWTEFAFYVGAGVLIYFLRHNIKNWFS